MKSFPTENSTEETICLAMGRAIEVSVVMPCLNEAKTIGACIDAALHGLSASAVRGEVVVADNGSADGSAEIARTHGARVVTVAQRGYGRALQAGIAAARGRYIIMGDADASYDFTTLGPFLDRLRSGDELVLGNRFRGGIRPGAMPWLHRYIGNPVLTGLLNFLFRTPVGDAHCGLRACRKEAYDKLGLSTSGMEFASEMVVKAALLGQRIGEVPVVLSPDGRDRPPHLRSFRDGWRHVRFLLLMCPRWLFLLPGLLLTGIGLLLMVALIFGTRLVGVLTLDIVLLLLGCLFFILGHQTLWYWAVANRYGMHLKPIPAKKPQMPLPQKVTLEHGLALAGLLMILGFGLNAPLFMLRQNALSDASDSFEVTHLAVWGCTLIVLGGQVWYSAWFAHSLAMAERPEANRS